MSRLTNKPPVQAAALAPREAVQAMAPYAPPSSGRHGKLRLDFNENTLGCSPRVLEFLRALTPGALAVYPEYAEGRPRLAAFFGAAPEQLVLTNGTDEAIQVLVNTFVDAASEVLITRPTYAMYRFYAELAGATVREVAYRGPALDFPTEELLQAITTRTRAILLANPNNPTGTAASLAAIEQILERAPQAAVLIDEAYFEFSGITALPLLERRPNLFVSRTFSKVYGLAALRMGCLFAQAGNAAFARKAQSPYSVNAIAARAACAAIDDQEYIRGYVAEVLAAREHLYRELHGLGIPTYPSAGNFILTRPGARAAELCAGLRERGVLVRDRSHEIPGTVRITAGTREQIGRLLEALREFW
jgi:histidinol-phosphate aminotransferase